MTTARDVIARDLERIGLLEPSELDSIAQQIARALLANGFVLVPRTPTLKMKLAGSDVLTKGNYSAEAIYRAMIAAAGEA